MALLEEEAETVEIAELDELTVSEKDETLENEDSTVEELEIVERDGRIEVEATVEGDETSKTDETVEELETSKGEVESVDEYWLATVEVNCSIVEVEAVEVGFPVNKLVVEAGLVDEEPRCGLVCPHKPASTPRNVPEKAKATRVTKDRILKRVYNGQVSRWLRRDIAPRGRRAECARTSSLPNFRLKDKTTDNPHIFSIFT